jgi:hypothetical protein
LQTVNRDLHLGLSDDYDSAPPVVSMSRSRSGNRNPILFPNLNPLKRQNPIPLPDSCFQAWNCLFGGSTALLPIF